ncbi:uncharacterized protein SEPMUDRAFT_132004 [Sphaerulina musiva SO2202]|uniref:Uncharacterized protein n=1 Tax=Sphaerulina musiva (strain SO2202) TaxID=692275 RepID=M3D835_SPHMS|nr:uncharacterized protein SEPMUDRAFT_132004 [Sphaerulina musiva SO2202]EMF14315.1 hypothetical protein SEPMUDRAFT_132004 [Sphaerulina musiva SO2202]
MHPATGVRDARAKEWSLNAKDSNFRILVPTSGTPSARHLPHLAVRTVGRPPARRRFPLHYQAPTRRIIFRRASTLGGTAFNTERELYKSLKESKLCQLLDFKSEVLNGIDGPRMKLAR